MIKAYTESEYNAAKGKDKLKLQCEACGKEFLKRKDVIRESLLNPNGRNKSKYCSFKCATSLQLTRKKITCGQCGKEIIRHPSRIRKSKSGQCFCSKHCTVKHQHANRCFKVLRSKFEIYIGNNLEKLFPDLKIEYNNKSIAEGLELDFYFPSLKLAFELNGIFHYEPVRGTEALDGTKKRDKRKYQICIDKGISLCIIDYSKLASAHYFKEDKVKPYLDIIISVIKEKMGEVLPSPVNPPS